MEDTGVATWEVGATSVGADTLAEVVTTTAAVEVITTALVDFMEVAWVGSVYIMGADCDIRDLDTVAIQVTVTLNRSMRHQSTANRSTTSPFTQTQFIPAIHLS